MSAIRFFNVFLPNFPLIYQQLSPLCIPYTTFPTLSVKTAWFHLIFFWNFQDIILGVIPDGWKNWWDMMECEKLTYSGWDPLIIWRKWRNIWMSLGEILGLYKMLVMKFRSVFLLLHMSFKPPLKIIYIYIFKRKTIMVE